MYLVMISQLARRCQSIDRLLYCVAILMKDTWFALAELAFLRVWLVVHSIYGPRVIALYTRF